MLIKLLVGTLVLYLIVRAAKNMVRKVIKEPLEKHNIDSHSADRDVEDATWVDLDN